MAVRPILFSTPMVRALLDGRKTMTRRVIKPRGLAPSLFDGKWADSYVLDPGNSDWRARDVRFAPGNVLWVRESHYITDDGDFKRAICAADSDDVAAHLAAVDRIPSYFSPKLLAEHRRLRPGIHMPRWASRLTLAVTAVKVERLQDISEDDALAEGIETDVWDMAPVARRYGTEGWFVGWPMGVSEPCVSVDDGEVCRRSFASLWNSINGPGAWEANPWVVALTFTVHRANVDTLPHPAKEA